MPVYEIISGVKSGSVAFQDRVVFELLNPQTNNMLSALTRLPLNNAPLFCGVTQG